MIFMYGLYRAKKMNIKKVVINLIMELIKWAEEAANHL